MRLGQSANKPTLVSSPTPDKFDIGDDFDMWEARVRPYLELGEPGHRRYTLLSLLGQDACTLVHEEIPEGEVSEETFSVLPRILPPQKTMSELRDEFRYRTQKSGEGVRQYSVELKNIARQALVGYDPLVREMLISHRFIDGVNSAAVREMFSLDPPGNLLEAVERAAKREAIVGAQLSPKSPQGMPNVSGRHGDQPMGGPYRRDRGRRFQPERWLQANERMDANMTRKEYNGAISKSFHTSSVPVVSTVFDNFSPTVEGFINGVKGTFLIDTGSSCTLVREAPIITLEEWVPQRLWAANNQEIKTLGVASPTFRIGHQDVAHQAIVVKELLWDAILGIDFLTLRQCLINLAAGILHIAGEQVEYRPAANIHVPKDFEVCAVREAQQPSPEQLNQLGNESEIASCEERKKLIELLTGNQDAFSWSSKKLGRTQVVRHHIDTGDAAPIKQPFRRIPAHYRNEVDNIVKEMLDNRVICPSVSPWASPVVIVKKDGTLRLCVDYRRLNAVTKKDAFPMPRIDETLEAVAGSKYFSTLDLASGYWQVEVSLEDRDKTAFVIPSGLYEFQTMPFGLTNAPATFQLLMQKVLSDLTPTKCLVYLDDIFVHSQTFQDHIETLRCIFERLQAAGLRLKPSKCHFLRARVQHLGHVISREGVHTDPEKVKQIQQWPTPSNLDEVRSFMGLASYYRRFVRSFAIVAAPLHRLTEKKSQFRWTEECNNAFQSLKEALTNSPVLAPPVFSPEAEPFVLDTDASETGIGAVLSQNQNGIERVIAYGSRCLNKHERNYCTTRKEMLALVYFLSHFRHYLLGKEFIVRTDHQALVWLQSFKDAAGQVARWQEKMQEYQFQCIHRPGRSHRNADALSRRP
ncbi:KRAB-A domain-containing protein [Fasciola hepatica]|uniref:RNA-directed DNA polymerase n=1 Tax=Fasciola hepatica TaxID=6192 RepID=A0A4E0QYY2_FASHE|nr:KRAB-A domain-containing protein [Fasciola hepatica]